MGKKFDKFCLLIWKNFLLQRRHPIRTLIEIMVPVVVLSFILVISRYLVEPVSHSTIFYTPFENKIPVLRSPPTNQKLTSIAWSPYNPTLHKIMDEAITIISTDENHPFQLIPFNDSKTMNKYLYDDLNLITILCGVQFDDNLAGNVELPSKISITFRFPGELRAEAVNRVQAYGQYVWKTNLIFPVYPAAGPRGWELNTGAEPSYYFEGFLKLQQELSYSIIQHFKNTTENIRKAVPVFMQRYPYSKWLSDSLMVVLQTVLGLIVMLSFIYTCISTVRVITAEKEKQLKEAMKIMGLPNWLHWTAWFLKSLCLMLVTIAFMVVILKAKLYPGKDYTIFAASNPLVIYTFLTCYICATITFCFAVSVFFSKANTAAAVAGMIWFLTYLPYSFTQQNYDAITLWEKLFASLFSNSAMSYGFQLIIMFEGIGEGVQWHNVWSTTTPDDNLKLGHLMIMLTIDTFIYLFIALYVETVFPREHRVPKVWYFPIIKSFSSGISKPSRVEFQEQPKINELYERAPKHLPVGVKIIHLRKEYPNNTVAVADLCLNMYQDHITVLLGHNGAGKTTTISMLTGIITPTSGTAIIGGCNIRTNMKGARKSLGLCPQHNTLFNYLTVEEHLYFYSRLKGLDDEDASKEIQKYVKLLELEREKNAWASTLSGGMQRKLSVGVALCGGSKVVVLDEPTAGMDPASRRALWNLLISQKKGRTMLLTTHFMDEADFLGDRIAIMSRGALQCYGSSFFLKKQYGAGYHLIINKSKKCYVKKVTKLLNKYIPNIKVKSNVESELTYLLSTEKLSVFEPMFEDLKENQTPLGIRSYEVSFTTLEDVFMIVGADHGEEEALNPNNSKERLTEYLKKKNQSRRNRIRHPNISNSETKVNIDTSNTLLTGELLWANQFKAMLMKRSLTILRCWCLFLIQCLIPVFFIILAIAVLRRLKTNKDLPKLKIQLDSYENPITVLTHDGNNIYAERYKEFLRKDKKLAIDWNNDNLTELILQETIKNISIVRLRYICGATFFENNSIKAWFNNEPFHSPPLTLQLVMNTILQQEVSPNHRIQIYIHPLPYPLQRKFTEMTRAHNVGFQISFNLGIALAFVSSFYAIFYIQERTCKSKHLQFLSGVRVVVFWGTSFLCDVLTFIVICLCIILTLIGIQEPGFTTTEELSRIFFVLICFGFAVLPLMYLASYLFNTPATGYTTITLVSLLTGSTGYLLVHALSAPELNLKHLVDVLHWILLIIPHYTVCTAIRDMYMMYSIHRACDEMIHNCVKTIVVQSNLTLRPQQCKEQLCHMLKQCCTTTKNYYDFEAPGIGKNIIYLCFLSIFLIIVLLLIEYHVFEKSEYRKKLPSADILSNITEDRDVKKENGKIRSASMKEIETYSLVMRDVTKYYGDFLAVNKICLAVNKFECFGLVGVNGAGKTTTFKIMTGDIKMSSGDAWVNGINLNTKINKVHQLTGYCPQFDALLDDLTCRETLIIFSLLRGIKNKKIKGIAEKLAREFDFYSHLDKKVKQLSGGNKRKLSAAVSLTGDPLVLYLDEPTTGMDSATKRHFWNAICKVRDRGTCIILTSHSMEECEALCTRMAIMVNGTITCLGSTQHLKNKFSAGYTLAIKARKSEGNGELESPDLQPIETYVKENFKTAVIREKHQELITFYITGKSLALSNMFGIMEKGRDILNIEDYSLGQSSLEQVYSVAQGTLDNMVNFKN